MSSIRRPIIAVLYPNTMTNAKGEYLPRTRKHVTYNTRQICESLKQRNGLVNVDNAEYYANMIFAEIAELICDGNKIDTGYFNAQANIKGNFNSKMDKFDPKRHWVETKFSTGHLMRKMMKEVDARIEHVDSLKFGISDMIDPISKASTRIITPKNFIKITGNKIKISGTDPGTGIYFINTLTGTEYLIKTDQIYQNTHSNLMFHLPEMEAGDYTVIVMTQYAGKGKDLVAPRSCEYAYTVTVE